MRVLVAGATGAIGRHLVPQLISAGHDVVGMTRSEERTQALRAAGAEPVVCDAFDAQGLERAVVDARPEVVVNELTDFPKDPASREAAPQLANHNRLREVGTRNLVRATRAAGARRLISQSIAFAYAPADAPRSEDDPLFDHAPEPWSYTVAAVRALEEQTLGSDALEGVVLRYGHFYGAGTLYASDGSTASMVRRRRMPIVGRGSAVYSFIHVEDAASATAAAVESAGAGCAYNVVDDDPAPVSEWLPLYAESVGAPRPRRVPRVVARLVAGKLAVYMMTGLPGASNERAKRELAWTPKWGSWRDGFREALG